MTQDKLDTIIEDAMRYYDALNQESDRAAAILAAAHFEHVLGKQIVHKFVELNRELQKNIFDGYGPLSTFSAKIDIAFALGLYDEENRKGLHKIRRIRNEFAHAPRPINFNNEKIADMCSKLPCITSSDADDTFRERYINYLQLSEDALVLGVSLGLRSSA